VEIIVELLQSKPNKQNQGSSQSLLMQVIL
jgi:hypothetical protein